MKIFFAFVLTALTVLTAASGTSHASLRSKLKNNRAVESLNEGDMEKAETAIGEALEADASDPLILYNWATTNMIATAKAAAKEKSSKLNEAQKKNIEASRVEFEKLLKSDSPIGGIGKKELLYQNAQSLELLENAQEALKNYYMSLSQEQTVLGSEDAKTLAQKTQDNITRLLAKQESSGSGEGGGGGGSEGEKEQQGEGQGQGENKSDSSQGQGGKAPREPEFKGTDVDQSQAQQILNSVSNQDRQVQQRKGQQQSKQNMQKGEEGDVSETSSGRPW